MARDITDRKRALQEQQHMLLREVDHRIGNLFTLSSSVVALSAGSAKTPQDLASAVQARLAALARAHALTLRRISDSDQAESPSTTLHALIAAIAAPYEEVNERAVARVTIGGPDVPIVGQALTSFALLLHEFATNAAKYGEHFRRRTAASMWNASRRATNSCSLGESMADRRPSQQTSKGFGSLLARMTVIRQLGGEIVRDWNPGRPDDTAFDQPRSPCRDDQRANA